jgi:SAM-dependent methyltransferase
LTAGIELQDIVSIMGHTIQHTQSKNNHRHGHGWVVGLAGLAAGMAVLCGAPVFKGFAGAILIVVALHLVGIVMIATSLERLAPRSVGRIWQKLSRRSPDEALDFGWSAGAMNLHWIGAVGAIACAAGVEMRFPGCWPLAWALLLFACLLFAGSLLFRAYKRRDFMVLPMVELIRGDRDSVLDAGCGAGRTTIALSRVLRDGRVTALDQFKADYIDNGGRELLTRNLRISGLADRVSVVTGDLIRLPFPDAAFDGAVSTHAVDHLGKDKAKALGELHRVLKPGGRLLLMFWVPGWPMFAVANVFSLFLTPPRTWKEWASAAGFKICDEGLLNGAWWVFLEKTG